MQVNTLSLTRFKLSNSSFFISTSTLSLSRCPANQVAVVDEVTGLLHCAPSPCGPTTCRNGGSCLAHSTKSYQCRCPEGFRGQWCEIGQIKALRLAPLSPSSILAISMCLLVFFGNYRDIFTHAHTVDCHNVFCGEVSVIIVEP